MKIGRNEPCPCGSGKKYKDCCLLKQKQVNLQLNRGMGTFANPHGYELNPTKAYVIDMLAELPTQTLCMEAVQVYGPPKAIDDWHKWLQDNGFDNTYPNVTNEFVKEYYGKKPLWKTDYSLGIVVKCIQDDDYYIVMECSRLNTGYKYTQFILTPGGCL